VPNVSDYTRRTLNELGEMNWVEKDGLRMLFGMQLGVLIHVLLAMFLGGLIGLEREMADKPAGLRTHMLVAGASALLIGITDNIVEGMGVSGDLVRSDPVRIVQAIVTGITFLGAGTIIRHKQEVEGLTTAASLLFVVTISICVALSQYVLAIGATLLTLLILRGIKWVESLIQQMEIGD
jgi:putative Mg2+ transporter-C (MgtC) family protein